MCVRLEAKICKFYEFSVLLFFFKLSNYFLLVNFINFVLNTRLYGRADILSFYVAYKTRVVYLVENFQLELVLIISFAFHFGGSLDLIEVSLTFLRCHSR